MTFVTSTGLNNDLTNEITQSQSLAKVVIYFYEVKIMKMIWCKHIELLVTFILKYLRNLHNEYYSCSVVCSPKTMVVSPLLCVHWSVCDHFFRHQIVVVCT